MASYALMKATIVVNNMSLPKREKCVCKNGILALEFTDYDKNKTTFEEIGCVYCDGVGYHTRRELRQFKIDQNIWCECESDHNSYIAKDGEEIFENTTWICEKCGMVSQFG